MFGFLFLLAALGFSLISRSEEEQSKQKACLSCNGYFETIESQVTEVGPRCAFNLRIAYPDLKGRFSCFRVPTMWMTQGTFWSQWRDLCRL